MQTTQRLFTNYISAGVQASLDRVRAAEYTVPEADRQQAWHILSFALDAPTAWQVTRELLLALAPKMEQAGFREEWIPYLEKGLHCAQNIGDRQAAAECELQIGLLHRLLNRFDEASRWTIASVEHFAAQEDSNGQARALNELAWLEHLQHHYQAASQHIEQALDLLAEGDPERAMSYRVKGMVTFHQGNLQEAATYHRQAFELFEQQKELRRVAWSLQNLAIALHWQNKFEVAFECYRKAAAILTEINDISNWGIVQMNFGGAYYYFGNAAEAVKHLVNAETIANQLHDKLQLARVHTHLGLAHLALNDYSKSEKAFILSINEYNALGDHGWRLNAMDGLAMTYLASKQYTQAMTVLQQALAALPEVASLPNYDYLQQSLTKHLEEAEKSQTAHG